MYPQHLIDSTEDEKTSIFHTSYDFSGPTSQPGFHDDNNNQRVVSLVGDTYSELGCGQYGSTYPGISTYPYVYHNSSPISQESSLDHSPSLSESDSLASPYPPAASDTAQTSRKGRGGRKKNLRPPSPSVMKQRRDAANGRERKRMNGLNDAFERLREVVPNLNSEQKMSKIETLLVAQTYIQSLARLIEEDERKIENRREFRDSCVLVKEEQDILTV